MALDPSTFLSTPAGSASPGQIAGAQQLSGLATPMQVQSMYDYAKALRDSSQTPVKAWTQGVANIVKALMGNSAESQAEDADRGRMDYNADQIPDRPGSLPGFGTIDSNRPVVSGGDTPSDPGLAASESGGNDQNKNPVSSAQGRYQFVDGTWKDIMQRHPDLGLTPDGRMDPAQQEKAKAAYDQDNDKVLSSAGYAPSQANERLAMRLGAGGATKVLGADPSTPMGNLMPQNVMAVNPDLQNATAGSTINRYASLGGPQLPPDAQSMTRALSGQTQVAQNGPMQPGMGGGFDPQATITQMARGLARGGMPVNQAIQTATEYVKNQIEFGPQPQIDPNTGAIIVTQPGQMPHQAGSLPMGGQLQPMAGIPGTFSQQSIGPNGQRQINTVQAQWPSSPAAQPGQAPASVAAPPPVAGAAPPPTGASVTSATGAPAYPTNAEEARTYPERMKAWEGTQEKIGEAGATAAIKPVQEVFERGGQKAQDYETVVDRMQDAYNAAKQYGGVGGGPLKDKILEFQELVNELSPGTFDPNKIASPEIIKKSTAQLVLNQLKEANPRFAQREFIALLNNNPSIGLSDTGSQYMLDLAHQQIEQDKKLSELAGESLRANDPYGFQKKVDDFYKNPANQTKSPFDHSKPLASVWEQDGQKLEEKAAQENGTQAKPGVVPPRVDVTGMSPDQVRKLGKGTLITLPDGKPGTVP